MEEIFWHWAVERWRCSSGHFEGSFERSDDSGRLGSTVPPELQDPAEPAVRKSQRFF
jgi:hypothetical protein